MIIAIMGIAMFPSLRLKNQMVQVDISKGFIVKGEALQQLTPPEGTVINLVRDLNDRIEYVNMSANISRALAPPSAGVFAKVGTEFEPSFSGQNIHITVVAKSGITRPLGNFQMAYFSKNKSSGWQNFTLTPKYKAYVFSFAHPKYDKAHGQEYIGIWPGEKGQNLTMDVKEIRVEIIKP
ncbi:MAG: hypothetical protein COA43_04170 [Robiginitomaculum sp.]|nr:MAG: hypothetical protein COA43_04170 [Robiginitomaculum sp.]